jgi:outer membrane protein TolC
LLQGFGPKVNMAPLEQAEYTEDSNRLALKTVVMQGITAVIQAYYQLAQDYNNLTTQQAALANSLQIVQQMQVQIKAGKVAPLELAPQQTQVANQELAVTQAKNQIEQDYQALLTVLGLDPHSHITIDKNIQAIPDIKLDLNQNTRYALENNIDYLNAVYGLKQSEIAVLLAKDQQKWTLDAVATENIQANNNGNQIGGLNLNTANARSLALNLTIPIDNKATQQQLVNAQVALDRAKIALDETRRSLRANVLTQMQSLVFQRQQILQAQQAVKFAEQAFNTELIKLKYGRTTVLSVTQLRDSLTQARLAAIAQQIAYINALAQFEQLVGITLDKWSIQIYY